MTLKAGLRSNGLDTQSNADKRRQEIFDFLPFVLRTATHCYALLRYATLRYALLIFYTPLLLHGNLWQHDGVLRTPFGLKISLL